MKMAILEFCGPILKNFTTTYLEYIPAYFFVL